MVARIMSITSGVQRDPRIRLQGEMISPLPLVVEALALNRLNARLIWFSPQHRENRGLHVRSSTNTQPADQMSFGEGY